MQDKARSWSSHAFKLAGVLPEGQAGLAAKFESAIQSSLRSVGLQSAQMGELMKALGKLHVHGPDQAGSGDAHDHGSDVSGWSSAQAMVEHHPELPEKATLPFFAKWVAQLAKSFLPETDVSFYLAADQAEARGIQGGRRIAFNLTGDSIKIFDQFLKSGKIEAEGLTFLLHTITHELTHNGERARQSTHNGAFYRSQEAKLARLTMDLEFLKDSLKRVKAEFDQKRRV